MPDLPHGRLPWSSSRPLVMGILNVTPDSFSDGGRFADVEAAVEHGARMWRAGAQLIDVGPESTRPGSSPVDAREQIRRAVPVVARLREICADAIISIDTRLAAVAGPAIDAGAELINDVSALRDDVDMASLAADRGVGVVLMHMQGKPATMQRDPKYANVVEDIAGFLLKRAAMAEAAGVARQRIILDPGVGFGKTTAHNLEIVRGLESFVASGYPVMLGASRKRFLGDIVRNAGEPGERLAASLACVSRAAEAGVAIVRVHDVMETCQLLDAWSVLHRPGK